MTTQEDRFHSMDEGELIAELLCITSELGGEMQRTSTLNSTGRSSKKIIIEYDIKQRV